MTRPAWIIYLVPVVGWLIAQSIKYIIQLHKDGLQLRDLYASGGMPSSHTAFMASLTTYLGIIEGWSSSVFVLAAAVTAIIMYDAIGVRRAVGEQGRILRELSKKKFHNAMGHSPTEVAAGLLLGVVIGLLFGLL